MFALTCFLYACDAHLPFFCIKASGTPIAGSLVAPPIAPPSHVTGWGTCYPSLERGRGLQVKQLGSLLYVLLHNLSTYHQQRGAVGSLSHACTPSPAAASERTVQINPTPAPTPRSNLNETKTQQKSWHLNSGPTNRGRRVPNLTPTPTRTRPWAGGEERRERGGNGPWTRTANRRRR